MLINIRSFLFITLLCIFSNNLFAQKYKRIHNKAIVVDTHNDILSTAIEKGYSFDQDLTGKTHSDLQRMKKGGIDVQIFSVWCDGTKQDPFAWANAEIDTLYAWTNRNPSKMAIVKTSGELTDAVKEHKLASMIGVEGGHMIENDLSKLDSLFTRGVRYMTLTWNNSTPWATSAMEETHDSLLHQPKGLNDFGKQVVKRMNELGMLIDLSHVGEQTFWDAINTTSKPVIVSHSCAYSLCPVFRNLKDDQIKAIGKNGGVIHLNFYSGFLDSNFEKRNNAFLEEHKAERDSLIKSGKPEFFADDYINSKYRNESNAMRAPFSLLFDHLDYIIKLIGVDHVGLGSDFDGITSPVQQLNDVTDFPLITKELLKRGYSKADIKKILGGNFIRVLKANEIN
ncbi:MAG TPA: dipeptidase [Chitinophagaceae bacterium]